MRTRHQHRLRLRVATTKTNRHGSATIEFALVASLFFGVVFACVEFNRVNMMRNLMQDAAYFAARRAMVPGAVMQDAVNEANAILGIVGVQGAAVSVNGGSELNRDTSQVSVTVTIPLAENSLILPNLLQHDMTSTAVMKTERYDKFYDGSL